MNFRLRLLLRVPAIAFFVMTALFGVLSYVPFAYLQFLRHQLFDWLAFFVTFHHYLYWGALLLGILSISDDLGTRRPTAWGLTALWGAYGLWLIGHPILPTLTDDSRSLVVSLLALSVPVGLALTDHLAARGRLRWHEFRWIGTIAARDVLGLCVRTASYVWLIFGAFAALTIYVGHEAHVSGTDVGLAMAFSLGLHMTAALAVFVILKTSLTIPRFAPARYAIALVCVSIIGSFVLVRVVFAALAFRGPSAVLIGTAFSSAIAFVVSGLSVRSAATDQPSAQRARPWPTALPAALLALAAFAAIELVRKVDWYFLMQEMIAFVVWIAAFTIMKRHVGRSRVAAMAAGGALLVGTVVVAATPRTFGARVSLSVDRYAAFDPSLMLLQKILKPAPTDLADVTRFLVANSNIEQANAAPVDLAPALERTSAPLPHIFIFVVDSLRRDYLSPYNPNVKFTPSIDAFARESFVFRRAFTRYGGTGLSEPAIWSGALLPHKEYVTPFAPMNALEKLLTAEAYHQMVSVDSILRQLLSSSSDRRELDAGIQNRLYDSCRTLDEAEKALPDITGDGRPVFVFTQPQDIHLANVAVDRHTYEGKHYDGFYRPYAARLERADRCFGQFVEHLKHAGLYENSIIILTSDHGDSLGDEGRWGHAYTVFPEVIRIPLIVHLPDRLRTRFAFDTNAVAFTTDITPTIYTLLGHHVVDREPLFGGSLAKAAPSEFETRRKEPFLVASSYGPVYGLLERNGEALYIIDAVNTAERRYDLSETQEPNGRPTTITDADRARATAEIRKQVAQIAHFYAVRAE